MGILFVDHGASLHALTLTVDQNKVRQDAHSDRCESEKRPGSKNQNILQVSLVFVVSFTLALISRMKHQSTEVIQQLVSLVHNIEDNTCY